MNPKKKKYYVEFVGAHGTGKTFTYHVITKQNLLNPFKAVYPGQMKRPKIHFAINWPIIALKNIHHLLFVVYFFSRYVQFRQVNIKVLRNIIKMIILHPYYYRFDFDVFLKDDMLHLLLRIIYKPSVNIEEALTKYFTHFSYLYDGLIFFETSPEIIWERFKHRFPSKSDAFKMIRLAIHERALQQSHILQRVLTAQKAKPFLVIDGSDDVNKNAEKIVSFLNEKILKI